MTIKITPPHATPLVGPNGQMSEAWKRHFDKVAAASTQALSSASAAEAVVSERRVNAGLGLQGGGALSSDVGIGLYVVIDIVTNLPTTGLNVGALAYATNARNSGEGAAAGTGSPVSWNGTHWRIPGVSSAVTA